MAAHERAAALGRDRDRLDRRGLQRGPGGVAHGRALCRRQPRGGARGGLPRRARLRRRLRLLPGALRRSPGRGGLHRHPAHQPPRRCPGRAARRQACAVREAARGERGRMPAPGQGRRARRRHPARSLHVPHPSPDAQGPGADPQRGDRRAARDPQPASPSISAACRPRAPRRAPTSGCAAVRSTMSAATASISAA